MEQDLLSPATGDRRLPSFSLIPPYRCLSSPQYYKTSDNYSIFSPKGSITPIIPASTFSPGEEDPTTTENRLYLSGLRLQCQDFANRYELCLSHLQDVAQEAEALRLENAQLRIANGELTKRLTGRILPSTADAMSFAEEFRKLRIENRSPAVESPTSVLTQQKISLPKSISVRSTGYKKQSLDGLCDRNGRIRVSKPVMIGSQQQQRVYVGGANKKSTTEEGALELEVYNQGMFKTELCNKWQETGKCPYGEHCQFAHGIGELCPVIRHPRYKTEVCRMVLAGDTCPYGHRCHFRHALTPSDHLRPT